MKFSKILFPKCGQSSHNFEKVNSIMIILLKTFQIKKDKYEFTNATGPSAITSHG